MHIDHGQVGVHLITVGTDVVTVEYAESLDGVEMITDGAADVYYTLDGTEPTIGGANTWRIPGGVTASDIRQTRGDDGQTVVKLVATSNTMVSVQRGR